MTTFRKKLLDVLCFSSIRVWIFSFFIHANHFPAVGEVKFHPLSLGVKMNCYLYGLRNSLSRSGHPTFWAQNSYITITLSDRWLTARKPAHYLFLVSLFTVYVISYHHHLPSSSWCKQHWTDASWLPNLMNPENGPLCISQYRLLWLASWNKGPFTPSVKPE